MLPSPLLFACYALLSFLSCADCRWWVPPCFRRGPKRASETSNQFDKEKRATGLRNLANTCYMNAILQGLYNTEEFRGNIVSSPFQDNSVGAELSNLFRDLLQGTGEAVSTRRFANALNLNVNTQEDAQEFFLRLLNELDDHVISSESEKTQKWRYSGHFRGELLQVINCSYIDFLKTRTQRFLDITVDIDGHSRLEDALGAMFCRPELLTGENKYKAGDFGLQEAEKRVTLAKLPKALCITLKRFRYDINSGGLLKIGDRLEFPATIDLTPYMSTEVAPTNDGQNSSTKDRPKSTNSHNTYELSSVIVHEGTANFGHYFCFARPDIRKKPLEWLKLNDHTVTSVDFEEVCETAFGGKYYRMSGVVGNSARTMSGSVSSSAYLLIYNQKDTQT